MWHSNNSMIMHKKHQQEYEPQHCTKCKGSLGFREWILCALPTLGREGSIYKEVRSAKGAGLVQNLRP